MLLKYRLYKLYNYMIDMYSIYENREKKEDLTKKIKILEKRLKANNLTINNLEKKVEELKKYDRKEYLLRIAKEVGENKCGPSNYTLDYVNDNKVEVHAIGVDSNESWCDGGVVNTIIIS
ncbi:MAG: hypothetical protein ACOCRX_01325 [Candidatus Woesearchaeota archaeon]